MSIKLVAEVWKRQTPGHPEQAVLLALADIADDDGRGLNPSQEYLAWKTEYSDRQVRRILTSLKKLRALKIVRKGSKLRSTEYALNLTVLPLKRSWEEVRMSGQAAQEDQSRRSDADVEESPDILTGPEITGHPGSDHRTSEVETPDTATADEPSEPSEPKPERGKPRERDVAFDALARATGKNPKAITPREGQKVGVALAQIIAGETNRLGVAELGRDYLARTITSAAIRFRRLHPTWECTPFSLADHWSELFEETDRRPPSPFDGHAFVAGDVAELCQKCGSDQDRHAVRSLEDQREDRDAVAELAAHARLEVENAGDVGAEVTA